MEKKVLQTYLYDFYGELLTKHQQEIYEDFVLQDLSLGEIAKERGISRQGVHDLIKRCDRQLNEYENKLRLLERFLKIKEKTARLHALTTACAALNDTKNTEAVMADIRQLSNEILEEL